MVSLTIYFNTVSIPTNTSVTLYVDEDIDNDGVYENTGSTQLSDGVTQYSINGYDGSDGNDIRHHLEYSTTEITTSASLTENVEITGFVAETATVTVQSSQTTPIGVSLAESTSLSTITSSLTTTRTSIGTSSGLPTITPTLGAVTPHSSTVNTTSLAQVVRQTGLFSPQTTTDSAESTSSAARQTAVFNTFLSHPTTLSTSQTQPQSAQTSPLNGSIFTTVEIGGQLTTVMGSGLQPTLSFVIGVGKSSVGLASSFADSLSASVGATTFINVNNKPFSATALTTSDEATSTSTVLTQIGSSTVVHGTSLAESDASLQPQTTPTAVLLDTSTATSNASLTVTDALFGEVDGTVDTDAYVEGVVSIADTFVQTGVVDTTTEAIVVAQELLAKDVTATLDTTSTTVGENQSIDVYNRVGRAHGHADPLIQRTGFGVSVVDGQSASMAAVMALTTASDVTAIVPLFKILYTSLVGTNQVELVGGQDISLSDTHNDIELQ